MIAAVLAALAMLVGSTAPLPAERDDWVHCRDLPLSPPSTGPGDVPTLNFEVKHRGLPVTIHVCVLDGRGTKVAEATGSASGVAAVFGAGFGLPPDVYSAQAEVFVPGEPGFAGASQKANLEACVSYTAPTTTFRLPGTWGVHGESGRCESGTARASI